MKIVAVALFCLGVHDRIGVQASSIGIAGYKPGSDVADHNALDKDIKRMSGLMKKGAGSSADFQTAWDIYQYGGVSRAEAQFTVPALAADISKGAVVFQSGTSGEGTVYKDAAAGDTTLRVLYKTTCKEGGYPASEQDLSGCFGATAALTISGVSITPTAVSNVYRTIKGFSDPGYSKMRLEPYFMQYSQYYDSDTYAHDFVEQAYLKTGTGWSDLDDNGRYNIIIKAAAYMNVFMYVIHEMEDAIDDCQSDCLNCNDQPVHAWDEAVAFYTGSEEGTEATGEPSGYMPFSLAEKRCANFGTCNEGTNMNSGAKANKEIFELFNAGLTLLLESKCHLVIPVKDAIVQKMSIPLIQGTLRYAYLLNKETTNGGNGPTGADAQIAEGFIFARAVLPLINKCRRTDAATIALATDITKHNDKDALLGMWPVVKAAFENNYECLNVTCSDIGNYLAPDKSIVEDGEACTFKISREIEDDTGLPLAAIIVIVVAAVLVVGFAFLARFYKNKLYYALMKKEIEASGLVLEAKSNGPLASENSKL